MSMYLNLDSEVRQVASLSSFLLYVHMYVCKLCMYIMHVCMHVILCSYAVQNRSCTHTYTEGGRGQHWRISC